MAWTKEQQLAIDTTGSNIIVSAGAGSGKTAVLTTRVIELIKKGIHIDELLILTFTNAAAKEMKERIKKKLKEEQFEEELNRIDSAYITTFDSFALSIVKKYHYLLNIPKQVSITDASILSLQKEKIITYILDDYYLKRPPKFQKLIHDFCEKDDKKLKKEILSLAHDLEIRTDTKEFLDNYIKNAYQKEKIDELINKYFNILKEKIEELNNEIDIQKGYFECDYQAKLKENIMPLKNASTLNELIALISSAKLSPSPKNSEEETKLAREKIGNILKEAKLMTNYGYEEEIKMDYLKTKDYLEIIIELLKKYYEGLEKWKTDENIYDFTDIAKLSLKLLKENENIKEELKNSIKEIMVDEYQDTSDTQEEFISLIENNNVYMVGDIKQSIYRFRNANPYIFKNKYDSYAKKINGIKIDLLKNFRSRKEVLDDINTIFNPIMTNEIGNAEYIESHQMIFGNSLYTELGSTNQNYNMDILEYNKNTKEFKEEEIEIFITAKDILNKINLQYLIFDKDKLEKRPIMFKDICIIMDRNTTFDLTKKIFEYFKIPLEMYKDEVLNDSMDLYILKNLIYLLIALKEKKFDKNFEYSFVSIARSYLYNLNDEEIFDTINNRSFFDSPIIKDIQEIKKIILTSTTKEIIEELLNKTKFYEKIITNGNILDSTIRIEKILELADNLSSENINIYKFYEYLEDLIKQNEVIKFNLGTNSSNAVKIMNIHKSKGLEFNICYFLGLYKKFSKEDLKGNIIYEKTLPIYMPNNEEGRKETILKLLIKDKLTKDDISEKIRLFYVALTRAKEKMIIILPKKDETSEIKENGIVINSIRYKYKSIEDMLNSIPNTLKKYKKEIDISKLGLTKDYLNILELTTKIEKNKTKLVVSELKNESPKKTFQSTFSKKTHTLYSKSEKRNIEYGQKVHNILEYIDLKNFNKNHIEDQNIANLIETMLQKDLLKNIKEAEIFQEYEFIYEEKEKTYHGIIDLMLVYDNHIDIIDYKLNDTTDEAYKNQLAGYKKYIESIGKKKVNTYLYSILKNEFKKIV